MENIANQYEMIVESVQKTCIAVTNKNLHLFLIDNFLEATISYHWNDKA